MAEGETPLAFLKGLRWMAIDGTVFDISDTKENGRVFGYPGSRKPSLLLAEEYHWRYRSRKYSLRI